MRHRLVMAAALLLAAAPALAQQSSPGVVEQAPGPQYRASGLEATILGDNWRDLWARPLTIPVLDIAGFEGGLTPERQGGGNQSITLHMVDATGRGWVFRSLDKYPEQNLPPDLEGAPAGDVVADQTSTLHPGGHLVVPRLAAALGLLHVKPALHVMPDHPRLGEFRETFAGMIGMLEEKPNEGPDDTPGFAGSRKIKDSDKLLEDLEESPGYRLDEREFLRARLLDFVLNDTDRGTDQWRWARFGEEGSYVYRPIPRDRDWTFVNGDGLLHRLTRGPFPKLARFGTEYPKLESFTFSAHLLDRRLLTSLDRTAFRAEVADVQRALTDAVIDAAVGDLPAGMQAGHAEQLAATIKVRRDRLGGIIEEWYEWLNREPDLRATDEDDRVWLEHQPDGTLRVRMATRAEPDRTYYDRTFLPGETHEVRVYLHGGDDHVQVSGTPARVRTLVVGGGGDDILEDRSGRARFYDARGRNEFRTTGGTYVSEKEWEAPEIPEGLRIGRDWAPDYGTRRSFGPAFGYSEGAGMIVGASHTYTNYGFRRLPYAYRASVSALYGLGSGGFGAAVDVDYRGENSRRGLVLEARATQLESFRFSGLGNDTPRLPGDESLVMLDRARVHPALSWQLGPRPGAPRPGGEDDADEEEEDAPDRPFDFAPPQLSGRITIGPVLQWTDARIPSGNPLAASADAYDGYGQLGARLGFEIRRTDRAAAPRRGFGAALTATGYAAALDVSDPFGKIAAVAAGYLPLLGETHLALRVGGEHALGEFPPWDAAFLGGRTSVRGYEFQRYAGESAAFGGAELRIPVDTVQLFFNGELGVFALADAGRVWQDEVSDGDWHTAWGGGVWFATLNRAISLTYAHGDRGRWYLWLGLPF